MARLHGRSTPAHRAPWRGRPSRRTAETGVVAVAVSLALALSGAPAQAAPSAGAQTAHDTAAAEVRRLEGLVTQAESEMQRRTVEAEAASDAARQARADLEAAHTQAATAAAELQAATAAVEQGRQEVADLGRRSYITGDTLGGAAAFLSSGGPADVLQRAATLDLLGRQRSEQLARFRAVQDRQTRADQEARAAVRQRDDAARAAAATEAETAARLADAEHAYQAAVAEKTAREEDLRRAEIALLDAQGVPAPAATWQRQQDAEAAGAASALAATASAAAAGRAVAPASGRLSSCYGARWGTMHYGVDIAAPIGTPIYAPQGGRVVKAGPATGFGLAVAIQHDDGTITLYGHVNRFFVTTGQAVSTGQQIAEVGNRGQSTGPHLHFEVHTGGLYANRVNPMPWLAARGISLGAGC